MPLLTVAEARKHLSGFPTGDDNDDALRRLLEAAEAAIVKTAGPLGEVTEFSYGGGYNLVLNRPADTFTSVTEDYSVTPLILATNDYRLSPSGYILSRLTTGTNSRSYWYGLVRVVYTPLNDVATREMVQVQLCQQFTNYNPGLTSETVGDWAQTFASNSVFNWAIERDNILSQLAPAPGMVVVGQ